MLWRDIVKDLSNANIKDLRLSNLAKKASFKMSLKRVSFLDISILGRTSAELNSILGAVSPLA